MTVFVTQEMPGRDLSDALAFGDLQMIIPAREQVAHATAPTLNRLKRQLSKFSDDDYLLLAGDPALIAMAAVVAATANQGRFKMLKWDRSSARYYPLEFCLNAR